MIKKALYITSGFFTSFLCDKLLSKKKPSKSKSVFVSSGVVLFGVASAVAFHSKQSLFFSGGASIWTAIQALRKANPTKAISQDVSFSFKEASVSIESLLSENGITAPRVPQTLKVVMDVYTFNDNQIEITRYFWKNAEIDDARNGWVPASVIKVFAAVSALQRLSDLGFSASTQVTFNDTGETLSISDLINRTLIDSNNMTYNRLVQLAGHTQMSEMLDQSFPNTELNKPYIIDEWRAHTQGNSTFDAPSITIHDGEKNQTLEQNTSRAPRICNGVSACTKLSELNSLMARATLFKNLNISDSLNQLLLSALNAKKPRGAEFSNAIQSHVTKYAFTTFNKHGFNGDWYSQTLVLLSENNQAFVISAVGAKGDRTILNDVGRSIGELINKAF